MAGRIPRIALILGLILNSALPDAKEVPLAGYSFDDERIDTGPDTFRVFENSKGRVSLSTEFPYSGYYSVQLQDVPYDGDFPELQGYFAVRDSGRVHFHFAFMVADPSQALNIALAGPAGFSLKRNGIGFWLLLQEGRLRHTSDSIPKPLFDPAPFVWYEVDMDYDIGGGRYSLRIMDGTAAVVDIKDAANASNQPGSVVDKFSFIGDLGEDTSKVNYFVDDIWISADRGDAPAEFVAPGRRKLFIDRWNDRQRLLQAKPLCLPFAKAADFGLSQDWLNANIDKATRKVFWQALSNSAQPITLPPPLDTWYDGIAAWQQGCRHLSAGQAGKALTFFAKAGQSLPDAPLAELSRIQALAALGRWDDVDAALAMVSQLWESDLRFSVAVGQIGFMRGDLRILDEWWNVDAETVPDGDFAAWADEYFARRIDQGKLTRMLQNKRRSRYLQRYVIAEQHFFSLLWRGAYSDAQRYAQRLARHFTAVPQARALWTERSGDAAFLGGRRDVAAEAYRTAAAVGGNNPGPLEKLADLAYLSGDIGQERRFREAVYGTLRK
ncbi:MAG: hypothetical protein ACU837_17190 [Gammaproteobacteria bacterium]